MIVSPARAESTPSIPENQLADGATSAVADVVEMAMRSNPVTRASYFRALAARAQVGIDRTLCSPTIDVNSARTRQSALGAGSTSSPSHVPWTSFSGRDSRRRVLA